jgi:3-oxoadipate enol-lactonase
VPVRLHHDTHGSPAAEVLVLSGSLGSTIEMWEPNLSALASRFLVVRLDHRGHANSPAPSGPCCIDDLAEDVLCTLDGLGIERFAWCGLSLGGMIGMLMASRWPERVSALVLCCTSAAVTDTSVWTERARRVADSGTVALAAEIVDRWFTPRWARQHPSELERARAWVSNTADNAYRQCCEAIADWNFVEQLPAIGTPTLVIAGRHDRATPIDPDARILASRIPHARLEILDAAHLATMEQPDAANRLLSTHVSG